MLAAGEEESQLVLGQFCCLRTSRISLLVRVRILCDGKSLIRYAFVCDDVTVQVCVCAMVKSDKVLHFGLVLTFW